MGEYGFLMILGVVAALAIVAGFLLRRPAAAKRRAKGKAGKNQFYREQARFVDAGGGKVLEDDDLMDLEEDDDEVYFKDDRF